MIALHSHCDQRSVIGMSRVPQTLRFCLGLLWALLSGGRGNYHQGSDQSIAADLHRQLQELETLRDQGVGAVTQMVPKKFHLKRVLVPASAPWLAYPATAVFRDADPKVVIESLLGEYPVVFQLSRPNSTSRVSHTGGEATLKDYLDAIMSQTNWTYRLQDGVMSCGPKADQMCSDDDRARSVGARQAAAVPSRHEVNSLALDVL